jgi:hypothetical protein
MKYELVNPSDHIIIDHDDFEAVVAASLIIGRGKYGLKDEKGETAMPIFLMGGTEEWVKETFNKTLEELIMMELPRLAAALEKFYAPHPTSLNNIVEYAHAYAKKVRDAYAKQQTNQTT